MGNEVIEIDDDASIDEEEIAEYKEMIDDLGSHPDKVKINSLTMVAEDHAESLASARIIYSCIKKRMYSTSRDNLLPLVYVLDSILKNAKGRYIELAEKDANEWLAYVHEKLPEPLKPKIQKVWNLWQEFHIFPEQKWKAMGRVFDKNTIATAGKVAGISRMKDGSLLLSKPLRAEMQSVLDEVQSDITDELNKVSLERLAEINPDLLAQIKQTAEESLRVGGGSSQQVQEGPRHDFIQETRSKNVIDRSKAWNELKWNYLDDSHDVISSIQRTLREGVASDARYTQDEAIQMTQYLATASAVSSLVRNALEKLQNQADQKQRRPSLSFPGSVGGHGANSVASQINSKDFTNDGVKKKNAIAIGMLYEIGLPFLSSADGRRFATQIELSNHLDMLFKKNQLEKSIAKTEERGWYATENEWCGVVSDDDHADTTAGVGADDNNVASTALVTSDLEAIMVPADESRDRCVICGINFKMVFDNEEGAYMYSNCREIEVLNDEVALNDSEQMLVHVSCWKNLGSPEELTMDQALQDTVH